MWSSACSRQMPFIVCVYVCARVFLYACRDTSLHLCGWQSSTLGVAPQVLSTLVLRFLVAWNLPHRLGCWPGSPGLCLSQYPRCWVYKPMPLFPPFFLILFYFSNVASVDQTQVPKLTHGFLPSLIITHLSTENIF